MRRGSKRRARAAILTSAVVTLTIAACQPDLSVEGWLVAAPRAIAVQGEPPETAPGDAATYTAFVATPNGASYAGPLRFSFCDASKPPSSDAIVAPACLGSSALTVLGGDNPLTAVTPAGACSNFGSVPPVNGVRPADPDVTGGYYQPLRVDLPGADPVFHLARIECGLGQASADSATEFAAQYAPNNNPKIAAIDGMIDGVPVAFDAVPCGARVALAVHWTQADAELYAYYDANSASVVERREAIQIAWFVNGGALATESTSVSETDPALASQDTFTAPARAGRVTLWVVLRDSRGGVDVATRVLGISGW